MDGALNFCIRIDEAAAARPDAVAIERVGPSGLDATTYGALIDEATRWAASLASRGVGLGDRIAILGDNDAPWIAAYLGTLRIGAVAVPLDTAYSATQIAKILCDCGARVLCTTARFLTAARTAIGTPGTPGTEIVIMSRLTGDGAAAIADVGPNDAAVILYTSGTTADPKGVVLTHRNLEAERVAALGVVDCSDRDAVLGVLPLFHALAQMANLLVPLAVGARVVFLETVSSSALLGALQDREISIFACVPQFFYLIHQRVTSEVARAGAVRRLLFRGLLRTNGWLRDHAGMNPGRRWFARVHRVLGPRMRILVTGGSRFDPGIGRDLYAMGFTLLNGYGLTETSGAATAQRPGDRYTTSVGHALPGVDIKIAAPDDEILIRGGIVMREYFNRPDATSEALRDGWLYTGDLGRLDADGRLFITGRRKEIIVLSSGKNLYPEELETHYQKSPVIKELCVLGLVRPGEPSAERLHAVVVPDAQVLRDRGAVNLRELMRFELEGLSVQMPAHKRILSYEIWMDPLPRTTTGKLRRHEIERRVSERAAAEAGDAPVDRPLSDDDRAWLSDSSRAAAMSAIAAALKRATVHPGANLELDLGLDSMERVELLTLLEQREGTTVAAETRATIFTVRELVEAVQRGDGGRPREGTATPLVWDPVLAVAPDPALMASLDRFRVLRAALFFAFIRASGLIARGVFGFRVSGQAEIPRTGPFILCPNHQSYFDGFFLTAALPFHALRRIFFVGAAEYFQTPVARWLSRMANIVPVDPDANLVTAMQAGAAGLRRHNVLVLFPEGERTIDGEIKKFKKGAAILAAHLAVPIVPVALDGLYPLWPRSRPLNWRGFLPWRAARVTCAFGAPITVPPGAYAEGTAALHEAVAQLMDRARREP